MPTPSNSINEATTGICGFTGTAFTSTPMTQYAVVCGGNTSSTQQHVSGLGTAAQVLTSNGAGALPTWQSAAASGAMTLISTATASSSATITFTGLSSTYAVYVVYFYNVQPVTDNVHMRMRTSSDNGSTYDSGASDYQWSRQRGSATDASAADDNIDMSQTFGNASNEINSGFINIYDPAGAHYTEITFDMSYMNNITVLSYIFGSGVRQSTSGVNAIQFYMSSGNIASGTFKLYGIAA